MIQTILSAIGVYISTSIDYLVILIVLLTQSDISHIKKHIYDGQFLGTSILFFLSFIAAYMVNILPEDWIIGLLGLIPIYLGIRYIVGEGEEDDEEEVINRFNHNQTNKFFITVALITIAAGADNLGVYVPYFASLNGMSILLTGIVFSIGIIVLCELSYKLYSLPMINETIEKYEQVIVPLIFIPLGIYILIENGTLQHIWSTLIG